MRSSRSKICGSSFAPKAFAELTNAGALRTSRTWCSTVSAALVSCKFYLELQSCSAWFPFFPSGIFTASRPDRQTKRLSGIAFWSRSMFVASLLLMRWLTFLQGRHGW